MQNPLHVPSVILLELLRGPASVMKMVSQVLERTDAQIILEEGYTWTAMQQLLRAGLIEADSAPPGLKPVRTPSGMKTATYYKLTPEGKIRAQAIKAAIQPLLAP